MNDTSNERNEQMVRIMAVIGFVVLVCLLAWLAVQAVRFIPTAFSSLANIFEANQRDYNELADGDDNVVVVENGEDDTYEDGDDVAVDSEDTTDTATTTDDGSDYEETDDTDTDIDSGYSTNPPVQYKTVVTHKIPVSDPNGFTDLAVSFSAIGYVNASGKFVPTNKIDGNSHGALQFVVQNVGTKTSSSWTFEAELPDGSTIDSKTQSPLKPKETSTLTVVFGDIGDDGRHNVGASISGGSDTNNANNGFRIAVNID